jgi:hypothetical protein
MDKMKDEAILRILVRESLKSELRLKRYGEKTSGDLFIIFGKWLELYLEIFSDSRVLFGNLWTTGSFGRKAGAICKYGGEFR